MISLSLLLQTGCGFGINIDDNEDNDKFPYEEECNDLDPTIYPGAEEIPFDGVDQNCDGSNDEDVDGDGQTVNDGDCNDNAPYIFTGAIEFKDEVDNDCDSIIDENNSLDEFVMWTSPSDYPSTDVTILGSDLTGDGYSEISVGETEASDEEPRSGIVHLLSADTAEDFYYQGIGGAYENDRFGSSLASGDIDGDGMTEFAIGSKGNDVGGTASGAVVLVSTDGLPNASYSSADVLWYGSEFAYAGASLAYSDTDNNQAAELLVGAYGVEGSTGAVYILDSASLNQGDGDLSSQAAATLYGQAEDDRFGWSIAGGSDLDGDGLQDFAVGAPQSSKDAFMNGAVYVYLGNQGAYPSDYDSVMHGEKDYDNAGYSLSTGYDVDGDGYTDLLTGAPGSDSHGNDSGKVYLIPGGPNITERNSLSNTPIQISGSTEAMQLGLNIAVLSDMDHDGFAEIVTSGLKDEALDDNAATYLFLGDDLTDEMTTGQASAVFTSGDTNISLVPNTVTNYDGQYYDTMGPYADMAITYSNTTTHETSVFLMLGQETKP
jgi:hypothetical protein